MRLFKVLSGRDTGGVKVCELEFLKYFASQGVPTDGLIFGKGPAVTDYEAHLEKVVLIEHRMYDYAGGLLQSLISVAKNELIARGVARRVVSLLETEGQYSAVGVRRPTFLQVAGRLGRIWKCPVLWHLANTVSGSMGRLYYRATCERWPIVPVANSQFTKDTLGIPGTPVIYPGVSADRVRRDRKRYWRRELDIESEAPVFGSLARLTKTKAQDLIIEAFVDSEAFDAGGHLMIGGGPLDSKFGAYIEELASKGKGRVHLLGHINEVGSFYDSIDVAVNGRRDVEPFGISVVEAMAHERPVIAYYLGGPSETIDDGKTGWLVDAPTVAGFRGAFDRAMASQEEWSAMGRSAASVAKSFSVESQAEAYLKLVERASRGWQPGSGEQ